ncbi:NUDIX domain-containing protein [Parashewanella spongiae]|uniref:ADP-ribose pyrophosphatase n=1 Tax=Parashewanella spongiae TaxID=342950 RepID=A0A3A6TTC9_9GAMM|nr:NUDIX domain-containing protein [Parashewanella spongiae]MCL1078323.1 NUDIX domain-containing protein [Parashewanella spongiae]RJY17474.1 NUDIX domain-containing protein [Parashewanella spongiae]
MTRLTSQFNYTHVQLIEKKTVFKGFFKVDEYCFKHRLFAGGWSQPIRREVFERGDAVVVLPYDPVTDKVILIEQIRIPSLREKGTPWMFELVAGMVDKHRQPEQVANDELFEEAGVKANSLIPISQIFASPGGTTELFYFYWASVNANDAKGIHGLDIENEDIRVHAIDRESAYRMVKSGEISNAASVIGLQWLQLNYQDLT